jgi:hypothetical protein
MICPYRPVSFGQQKDVFHLVYQILVSHFDPSRERKQYDEKAVVDREGQGDMK